ncbi:MAG TPA: ABC transporter permease [bacterium]|nr:ABC transporter permease [bacterium]
MFNLFIANLKMLMRNKQALFWSLMFPLMFTFIFGFFFGKNNKVGTIAVVRNSNTEIANGLEKALTESDAFTIKTDIKEDEIKRSIETNKIAGAVVVPEKFGESMPDAPKNVKIIFDPGNAQVNQALAGYVNGYLTQATLAVNRVYVMTTFRTIVHVFLRTEGALNILMFGVV